MKSLTIVLAFALAPALLAFDNLAQRDVAVRSDVPVREITVTNSRDAGEGSFRAAIERANDSCTRDVRCVIAFRMEEPMPPEGIRTIRLLTPLPPVVAPDVEILAAAGEPQRQVVLDGSVLATGHGLEVVGEGPWVIERLTIVGFPWDGVSVRRRGDENVASGLRMCTIGVLPTGSAVPNGGRGVSFEAPTTHAGVEATWIAANGRSGISVSGASQIQIRGALLGPLRHAPDLTPGNGASGIAILGGSRDVTVVQSAITRNGHFGIAVAPGIEAVRVRNSLIYDNGGLPIDQGIDGFSGYLTYGSGPRTSLPAPLLTSVTWDAATQLTTISGTFDAPDERVWELTLVAKQAFPFNVWPEASLPTHSFSGRTFSFTVPYRVDGSLRAYVNSLQPSEWSTSELSEPAGLDRRRRRSVR